MNAYQVYVTPSALERLPGHMRQRVRRAISDQEQIIDILAVRQRPPYDYGDLVRLLSEQG